MASSSTPHFKAALFAVSYLAASLLAACSSSSGHAPAAPTSVAKPTRVSDAYCQIIQSQGGDPGQFGCDPAKFPSLPPTTYANTGVDSGDSDTTSEDEDANTDNPTYVGTFTVHGSGDTVTTKITAGPAQTFADADVPQDVLSACNWDYGNVESASVFLQGQLAIHYSGSVAQPVSIVTGGLPQVQLLNAAEDTPNDGAVGAVGIQPASGSGWDDCTAGNEDTAWVYNLQPNTATTVDFWARVPVLSNAHPHFTDADRQAMAIGFYAKAGDQGNDETVSGPQAASCSDDDSITEPIDEVLLYATPPHTYRTGSYSGGTDRLRCAAA